MLGFKHLINIFVNIRLGVNIFKVNNKSVQNH